MKKTFYFSHDYNARADEKIIKLLSKEGWGGYGIFWAIIEKLYEANGWINKDYDCIAFDMRTDRERIARIIEDYDLFVVASEKIHSDSVLARLRIQKGKSEQAKQSANLRWNKRKKDDANALRTQSEGNAIKESKVKESKVNIIDIYSHSNDGNFLVLPNDNHLDTQVRIGKDRIGKVKSDIYSRSAPFSPPTIEDINHEIMEKAHEHVTANEFFNYYESNGWKVGKNKMKNWKAALSGWNSRNSPKENPLKTFYRKLFTYLETMRLKDTPRWLRKPKVGEFDLRKMEEEIGAHFAFDGRFPISEETQRGIKDKNIKKLIL